jgi:hypothetical protein
VPIHDEEISELLKVIIDDFDQTKEEFNNGTRLQRVIFKVKLYHSSLQNRSLISQSILRVDDDNSPVKIIEYASLAYCLLKVVGKDLGDDALSYFKEMENEDPNSIEYLKDIMNNNRILLPDVILLSTLNSANILIKFLSKKKAMEYINLNEKWFIDTNSVQLSSDSIIPVFQFQLDSQKNTTMGMIYQMVKSEVCQPIPFDNFFKTNNERNNPNYFYHVRICLFLCLYYEYFSKRIPSPVPILDMLRTDNSPLNAYLQLTSHEKRAFIFVGTGPYDDNNYHNVILDRPLIAENIDFNAEKGDIFINLLMISNEQKNLDLTHTMMNIVAFALGTPKSHTHIYDRIFDPEKVPRSTHGNKNTCVPGSAGGARENYDCYFQDDGTNLQASNVMGGVLTYRQCLNFITWGALALGGIFREDIIAPACIYPRHSHFMNYLTSSDVLFKGHKITPSGPQNVRMFAYTRPLTYFSAMKLLGTIEPSLYITNFLHLLREYCLNPATNNINFTENLSFDNCIAFEGNCFTNFTKCDTEYPEIVKLFEENQTVNSPVIKTIRKIALSESTPQTLTSNSLEEFMKYYISQKV